MARTAVLEREAPAVVARKHAPLRSRLPTALRVPVLVALNLCLSSLLREWAFNFLEPELGAVSKIPDKDDVFSLFAPLTRLGVRILTVWITWYLSFDSYDVSALTVLTQVPYAYLLTTFYDISALFIATEMTIEVIAFALPTALLRPRSALHQANAPLRNRFLLNSIQVQVSNALLASSIYVVSLWALLKTEFLTVFLVRHFNLVTMEVAHSETPVSIVSKILVAGIAAKDFLLNPSIAAQPFPGKDTPVELFEPAAATLPQTVRQNLWYYTRRTRTLVQQTFILNAFLFATTVQRCLTLEGTEITGAVGYALVWVLANSVIALWFGWVGDTSADYEPL